MSPAGFWQRYAAWSLDAAIIGVPVAAIAWPHWRSGLIVISAAFDAIAARTATLAIEGLRSAKNPLLLAHEWLDDAALQGLVASLQSALAEALQPAIAGFVVLAAIYWIVFECSPSQATPGKRALGLIVADLRGQRIGMPQAALRHVAGLLSWLTLNLGHALAALPPHKRALHDHLAGTRVLQRGSVRLPAWARVWLALQVLAAVASTAWLMRRIYGALQIAIDNAL